MSKPGSNGNARQGLSRRGFLKGAAVGAIGALGVGGLAGCGQPTSRKAAEAQAEEAVRNFTPGVYYGIGQGRGGAITAEVTLSDHRIERVQILSHTETPIISDAPLSWIPQDVVANQSLAVDVVTHATTSSLGIIEAITNAMASSGCDMQDLYDAAEPRPVVSPALVDAQIAIVGGGCCGMAAAIRAAQLGVPVVLFEQAAHLGGDALVSEGWTLGAGTLMQKAAGEEDSGEQCWQDLLDNINAESKQWWDEELCRNFILNSGRTVDWLDRYVGARFNNREITNGTYGGGKGFAHRIHFLNGGLNLIKPMVNKINEGIRDGLITVMYQTEVTDLLTDGSGTVCGVKAVDASGATAEYPFDAVLLATGGFHQNREMVEKYLGPNYLSGGRSTSTGSGYALCENLGCELVGMEALALLYAGGIPSSAGFDYTLSYFAEAEYPGVIWVDVHGVRGYNETASQQTSHLAWKMADQQIMNIVFPESERKEYRGLVLRDGDQDVPFTPAESWALFDKMLQEGEYVFEADSARELAEKLGVDDVDAFVATIEEVNACAESGQVDSLGRTDLPKFEGKLYGIKTFSIIHNTGGGVKRNSDYNPLTSDGAPIEGLYVAGELCGIGYVQPPTKVNVLGGGTGVGGCTNQGRIAAETIIKKLTGMDTELPFYEFEGTSDDYEISVFDSGDYIGAESVFKA